MSKVRFPLYLLEEEHRDLRIAAAMMSMTMTDFVRTAIKEKIQRQAEQQSDLAEACEKPA